MKKRPPKNKDEEDLSGFLELMELGPKKIDNNAINLKNDKAKFDLINFLEKEELRLNYQSNFFLKKTPTLKKYNQINKIISNQEKIRDVTKTDLINLIENPESTFNKNMNHLFQTAFLMIG